MNNRAFKSITPSDPKLVKARCERLVKNSDLVIFIENNCSNCIQIKEEIISPLIKNTPLQENFKVIDLNKISHGSLYKKYLRSKFGKKSTVPYVFIKGEYVLDEERIRNLLNEATANVRWI
mmetsp:Transcript_33830/g.49731  ORF Transcript_33830/g.49731 Transcript_33830/m.49731 type:complete len:121 (+) Transcript_33830:176-538(+)